MPETKRKLKLWLPLLLLVINSLITSLLIKGLISDGASNFNGLAFMTTILGLISFSHIRESINYYTPFLITLQVLNWIFIITPFVVIAKSIFVFI